MSRYVTDTHALHWHLVGNPKLSATAQQIFQASYPQKFQRGPVGVNYLPVFIQHQQQVRDS